MSKESREYKASLDRARAIKTDARASVAKLAAEGRSYDALKQSVSYLGIDLSKGPLVRRQVTFSGVRID